MSRTLSGLSSAVEDLRRERALHHGQLVESLRNSAERHAELHRTAQALQAALAKPGGRGQWGERMADDVLRASGFVPGVNYVRQQALATGVIPDVTFPLPGGLVLHMDIKFPVDNYLRLLEASSDTERDHARLAFIRDVRQRVTEVAKRGYIEPGVTLDVVLLFIPNEAVYAFAIENDPQLVDRALAHGVVLCSPITLFAVLAVLRRSIDTVALARASDEVIVSLRRFRSQWDRFVESFDRVERQLDTARRSLEELSGVRRRQLDRELERIEQLGRDPVEPCLVAAGRAGNPLGADHPDR